MTRQQNMASEEKKKRNPIVWFLFAIVIPIIVAVTLAVIIFAIAGIDVIDWAKEKGNNIPGLANVITTKEEAAIEREEERTKAVIDNKDAEIEKLTQNINDLETAVSQLEQEILKLENSQVQLGTEPLSATTTGANGTMQADDPVKTVASSYAKMDSKQAALIMESLERDSAVIILQELSNKIRGSILEEMDPQIAAEITQLLMTDEN